jgi:hypothetical protein
MVLYLPPSLTFLSIIYVYCIITGNKVDYDICFAGLSYETILR